VLTVNTVYQPREVVKSTVPLAVVLVLACGAQLMVVLDGLIVNVALPQMRSALGLSLAAQQWVVTGYLITFGGLLLLAARAADLFGHRRVFLVGVAVFTLASLAGGLAHDGSVLLAARVVQGVGAAALAPSSLSLLTMTHTGEHRARALSIWSATSGSAGALGLVLGGVVTGTLGWRWVLLINAPIGVALWIVASASLVPSRVVDRAALDVPGAITVTLGIGALVYGISQAQQDGWGSIQVVVALVASAGLLAAFLAIERRSRAPLVPLPVLRRRNIIVANAIVACLGATMTATMYFLSLYQQRVLGDSPLRTGLALVPMSIVLTLGAIASKSLLPRFGVRRLVIVGAALMCAGLLWMATMSVRADYPVHILGPTLLWAAGASIVTMPCVALATGGIEPELAGLASGLVNTARQTGGAIGLAALAAVAAAASTHAHDAQALDRVVHGYDVALITAAGVALLLALLALQTRATNPRGL